MTTVTGTLEDIVGHAFHGVGEEHVIAQRIGARQGAGVILFHAALDSMVGAGEDDVHGPVPRPASRSSGANAAPVHSAC